MGSISTVAKITVKELLFRIEQYAILGVGLLIILPTGILYLNDSLAEQVLSMAAATSPDIVQLPRDTLVSSMFLLAELFITVSALFTISMLISRDIQQKTLSLFLSKSMPRWHYFLGKYIGGTASLCITFSFYAVIIFFFVLVQSPSLLSTIVISTLFVILKLALLSALIMSSTERFLGWLGAMVAVLYYIFGHINIKILEWSIIYEGLWGDMLKVVYYILPNLSEVSSWSLISAEVENYPIHINYTYWFAKQIGVYTIGFLFIGYLSFKRKSY